MKKRYVLIPAYKPGETLLSFIQALEERNLNVIVVNDGSGAVAIDVAATFDY